MSKKSSSQANQTTTSMPITLQDVEGVTFAGNSTGGGAITITDGGAIQGGLDLAGLTVEKAAELTLGLVAQQARAGEAALQAVRGSADQAFNFAMSAGRSDIALIKDGGRGLLILAGIIAGAYVLSKWGKK